MLYLRPTITNRSICAGPMSLMPGAKCNKHLNRQPTTTATFPRCWCQRTIFLELTPHAKINVRPLRPSPSMWWVCYTRHSLFSPVFACSPEPWNMLPLPYLGVGRGQYMARTGSGALPWLDIPGGSFFSSLTWCVLRGLLSCTVVWVRCSTTTALELLATSVCLVLSCSFHGRQGTIDSWKTLSFKQLNSVSCYIGFLWHWVLLEGWIWQEYRWCN